MEYFCPVEDKWQYSSPLSTPRSGSRAMVVDDRIIVLGGYDGNERLSSVESFTPGARTVWHQIPDMMNRRSNFCASLVEGKLMVVGGYKMNFVLGEVEGEVCGDVELYCPKEKKWTTGPSLNIKRSALDSVIIGRGNIKI